MKNTSTSLKKEMIQIYDTSLRDGTQGMEINYTLKDKLEIVNFLDSMHIDYIEGGFPLSSEKEAEFFTHVQKMNLQHAKIASFGSTAKNFENAENDPQLVALLNTETPVVTIVGKASSSHVKEVIKTTLDNNLKMIFESVSALVRRDREVILDLEHFFDGYKLDSAYSKKVLQAGTEAGANMMVLCDTNGGTLPHEIAEIMGSLQLKKLSPIGGHFHDDCGVGVANSLVSLNKGAVHIQGTMNGWGERVGNANLCTIIPNIILKDTRYTANCAKHVQRITGLSRFMADKANLIPDPRQPFVGTTAFSHKAGQHADVILKKPNLMEHIQADTVGNKRHILLSELAGKSTIVEKLKKFGEFKKEDSIVSILAKKLKKREIEGYEYESAEASFEIEMLKSLKKYTALIQLKNYHIEMYKSFDNDSNTVCRLFLHWMGQDVMGAAVGVGPVDTLDKALRNALSRECKFIDNIKMIDYKVRVVNSENNTAAKVRVFIRSSDGNQSWETIGVHENILEASWLALIDSYEYYYHCVLENDKNPIILTQKMIKNLADRTSEVTSNMVASVSDSVSHIMKKTKANEGITPPPSI